MNERDAARSLATPPAFFREPGREFNLLAWFLGQAWSADEVASLTPAVEACIEVMGAALRDRQPDIWREVYEYFDVVIRGRA